jgi:hypothetical protein
MKCQFCGKEMDKPVVEMLSHLSKEKEEGGGPLTIRVHFCTEQHLLKWLQGLMQR